MLERVFANRMPQKIGGIALAHMLNDDGAIEGEATVTRLGKHAYYILSAAAAEDRDFDWLGQHIQEGEDVTVTNVSQTYGNLVLAGPKARDVLSQVTRADLSNEAFRWFVSHVEGCAYGVNDLGFGSRKNGIQPIFIMKINTCEGFMEVVLKPNNAFFSNML